MSKLDRESSRIFYKCLCNIIGTEEVVKIRRKIFCALDSVVRVPNIIVISSGSKAEGLDLKGSDCDTMLLLKRLQVHENMSKVSSFTNTIPIIMDNSNTKPGFTKLKCYNFHNKNLRHINMYADILDGDIYVSSKLFREYKLRDHLIIHGPCQSQPNDSHDMARCLRCKEWIAPACQWVLRSRLSWPDQRLVTSVVQNGVLFVPIGIRGSLNEDLEWRISFSIAEKQLIFSFTHTQLLCYALMKILLKDIIKKKHSDLICSYFLKTIMFWLCEESSPSEWHPENIITCFENCLRRLIYCVEYKTCLHYFIPENNFFEDRFTDYQHKYLLETLYEINHSFWNYLFSTSTFQRFLEEQRVSVSPYLTASFLSFLNVTRPLLYPLKYNNIKQTITQLVNISDTEISSSIMSMCSINWMQSPVYDNFIGTNRSVYKQYKITLRCFKAGLYHNAVCAWSLLASLFYKHKRFNECIDIVNYTLSKCTPDKIELSFENTFSEQTHFQRHKETFGLLLTCKHLIICTVSFNKPYYLLPVELTPLVDVKLSKCGFPPVVFLNMLTFLCLHHLRDNRRKLYAFRDLELTIQERYFIFPNKKLHKIANNCLKIAKVMM